MNKELTDRDLLRALLDGETFVNSVTNETASLEGNTIVIRRLDGTAIASKICLNTDCWKIKQKTILINNIEVPEPLRVAPKNGTTIYAVSLLNGGISYAFNAENTCLQEWLAQGILHLSKENADIHAKAILSCLKKQ